MIFVVGLAAAACSGSDTTPASSSNGGRSDASTGRDVVSGADAGADAGASDTGQPPMECNAVDNTGCGNMSCLWVGGALGVQCRMEVQPPAGHEEPCNTQLYNCRAGYACILFQGEMAPPRCRKVCRTGSNADCANLMGSNPDGYRCGLTLDRNRSLGLCEAIVPECLPFNDMCDQGNYCEFTGGRLVCVPPGTPARGAACPINRCQAGSICITLDNMALCREPCDPDNPACTSGMCERVTGQPFGVCR